MKEEISKYVSQVIAYFNDDKVKVIAIRNERLSKSALKGQLATLDGLKESREVALEGAQQNYKDTVLNVSQNSHTGYHLAGAEKQPVLITDAQAYIQRVKNAQDALNTAKEQLETTNESIAYWNALLNNKDYF